LFLLGFDSFKNFQGSSCERKKEREKKKSFETRLLQDMSLPHLISLFPTLPIPVLLVGRGVTTQVPSSSSNINNNSSSNNTSKKNSRTQSQIFFATFNIQQ
jgi:hypothetical protein